MILEIRQGEKSYGADTVFSELDFLVKEQEKIALIGRNGAGKTTLLRIIEGSEKLDKGQLIKSNKTEIGYLSQTAVGDDNLTAVAYLKTAFKELLDIEKRLTTIEEKLATDYETVDMQEYAKLQSYFQQHDGYNIDYKVANIFTRFGFKESDLTRNLTTFSGGQKTKIAFVKLLLRAPDLLILDEPTNHLDLETIQWLEEYLRDYPKALVIVSHDRYFIDHVCNVTYEIELGKMTRYGGNYTFYQNAKKIALAQEEKLYKNQQEEIERLEILIEKFRYKKNKAAFAQSKIKYLEKMEKVELTKTDTKTFKADFTVSSKGGKTVCVLENYTIGYTKPLAKLSLSIQRSQRIGIIGPNGCGKSTLLKSLAERIPNLGGEMILGHQISVGFFEQQLDVSDNENSVIEELWAGYPYLTKTEIRTILGHYLFSGDDVFKKLKVLSGGELVRLALAKLMLEGKNFLMLDEPTNHLDIPAKEALEEALLSYSGTLMFVSHDRYFINRLANSMLVYEEDNFRYYPCDYREYLEITKKAPKTVSVKNEVVKTGKIKTSPEKAIAKLERQIAKAETKLSDLQALLYKEEYYLDFLKMQKLQSEIDAADDTLSSLLRQWEELH